MKKGFKFRYEVCGSFPSGKRFYRHFMDLERARQDYFYLKNASDANYACLYDNGISFYLFDRRS